MNQRIDFTKLGGFPLTQDRLAFMQDSYRNAFEAIAGFVGSLTILSGVVVDTTTNTVSDGWITYNGEMMPFVGGLYSGGVVVQEVGSSLLYKNGDTNVVLFKKFAQCGTPATFSFSALKYPQNVRDFWCKGDIKNAHVSSAYITANFDNTGKGVNERLGWAIRNGLNGTEDARGRVRIAWDDRTVNPNNGIWDLVYNTPGYIGGALTRVLTILNIPKHRHLTHANGPIWDDSVHPNPSWYISTSNGSYSGPGGNLFGRSSTPDANMQTGDAGQQNPDGVDIRQPFIVNLEIEKL